MSRPRDRFADAWRRAIEAQPNPHGPTIVYRCAGNCGERQAVYTNRRPRSGSLVAGQWWCAKRECQRLRQRRAA